MADYRLLLANVKTGAILGELPAESFSWSEVLNGAGGFAAVLPLDGGTTTASVPVPYYREVLDLEPSGFWRLHETGSAAVDASGNGWDGTYVNNPTRGQPGLISGDNNASVLLDGISQRVSLGNKTYDVSQAGGLTVGAWITPEKDNRPAGGSPIEQTGTRNRVAVRSDYMVLGSYRGLGFSLRDTAPDDPSATTCTVLPWLGTNAQGRGTLNYGQTYFVVLVYEGGGTSRTVYVDGEQAGAVLASGTATSYTDAWYIGQDPVVTTFDTGFKGAIDEAFVVDRALTAAEVADLYAKGTGTLNATPAATYSIVNPSDLTFDGSRAVYVERDGVVLWGGLLWTAQGSVGANSLSVNGEGFWSYFRRRFIRETLTFSASTDDQMDIARALVDYAQGVAYGDIGLDTSDTNVSGVKRDRTYYGFERKNVAEAVEQLAAVDNGFDFRVDTTNASGSIVSYFRTSYPTTGRVTDHVFEVGSNVEVLDFTLDGTSVVNTVDAVGAGEGEDLLIATATDPSTLLTRPLLEAVLSHTDVREETTLTGHATLRLIRGKAAIQSLKVEVLPGSVPGLGSYVVGDRVRVRGSYGYLDVDGFFRIVTIGVAVDSTGSERVTLDLVPLEVFA